jgi:cardiolipin synthase (CMP-forming)
MLQHIPNLLTGLRMLLVLPLFWLIRERHFEAALGVAAFAGLTDALDGYVAKRYGWVSWLGGVLDPVADKLLLVACFVAFGMDDLQPFWFTALVIGRDAVIVSGAVAYHNLVGPLNAEPTLLSKITTCVQIAYVLAVLVHLTRWVDLPNLLNQGMVWLVAMVTLSSGLHYVISWSARAWRETHRRNGALP